MIVKEDFLKHLRSAFDLNIYEVKIWTALLSRGLATAGELSDISNVPRSRSYDVLESLEKKGFVIMKIGKPIKYIAVSPDDIIRRVKKTIMNGADEKLRMLDKIKLTSLFNELELLHKHGIEHVDAASLSGAIKGRNAIYNHIESMLNNAQKSVTIVTTSDGFKRKVELFKKVKKLKDRGVKVRVAVTSANGEVKKLAKEFKNILEVRHVNDINGRFVIVDGKEIIFMLSHDKDVHESYDLGIWVTTPFFASAMENMFNINGSRLNKV